MLSGCAKRPGDIPAADISEIPYRQMTCPQMIAQRQEADASVQQLSLNQNAAAESDVYGVLWLGLPVASMSGRDQAPTLAFAKGKLLAIDRAMLGAKCALPGSSGL